MLIFGAIAQASAPEVQPWAYWTSYFAAAAVAWIAAMLLAQWLFRLGHAGSVIAGFAAGQSNTIFVGIPLILRTYGNAGTVPLFLLLAIHLPIMVTAVGVLIESRGRLDILGLLKTLLMNPIVHGLAAGTCGT